MLEESGRGSAQSLSWTLYADRLRIVQERMESLQLCLPATTLGDIYTLALHPASSSHRSLSEEDRLRVGITEGLVRLSVGIEDATDIIADLEQALGGVA